MQQRLNYPEIAPAAIKAMLQVENYVRDCSLERSLVELVKLRASQLNGCAHCIDMHTKDARTNGESEQRLYAVSAWEEAPFFTERERAALAWTEAVTLISHDHVPDRVFDEVRPHFTDKELVDLTMTIIAINGWNRLAVTFRTPAGGYQPDHPTTKKGLPNQS